MSLFCSGTEITIFWILLHRSLQLSAWGLPTASYRMRHSNPSAFHRRKTDEVPVPPSLRNTGKRSFYWSVSTYLLISIFLLIKCPEAVTRRVTYAGFMDSCIIVFDENSKFWLSFFNRFCRFSWTITWNWLKKYLIREWPANISVWSCQLHNPTTLEFWHNFFNEESSLVKISSDLKSKVKNIYETSSNLVNKLK